MFGDSVRPKRSKRWLVNSVAPRVAQWNIGAAGCCFIRHLRRVREEANHRKLAFFDDLRSLDEDLYTLRSQQSQLQDIKILRNAIAHSSSYSWEKYQSLVRRELVTYPPGLKIGGFLSMTKPGSSPPSSFLESHLTIFRFLAGRIVPS